ncbi:MAG: hypothetical protein JJU05_06980 [Verrucomicrobia bacterium]|nr:hypothetical protein [Verrucomicrobiota bacterium]MCH8526040.1 hypothetical protein [Kiritimatiellia bacterium]
MTLVEVLLATMIFSMVALSSTRALLQARRLAEYNVHLITVNTVIEGYLEQMKSMTLDQLTSEVIPTTRLVDGAPLTQGLTADGLRNGILTEVQSIDVNGTPDNPNDDIRLFVQPIVTDRRSENPPHVDILLNYRWIIEGPNGSRLREGSVRYIRSAIRNS